MPRPARILYDRAVYHILQRGHNKDRLFHSDSDFETFRDIIHTYKKRYDFHIYHYCLMPNHFHMLMRIAKGEELPKVLHGITQSYSHYYRRLYKRCGYVYQNRYKSFHIEKDSYLSECGRYIERNPLRACIVKDPSEYQWSSYNFYTKGKSDEIVTENPLYSDFGVTSIDRRKAYEKYILETRPYETLLDTAMIG